MATIKKMPNGRFKIWFWVTPDKCLTATRDTASECRSWWAKQKIESEQKKQPDNYQHHMLSNLVEIWFNHFGKNLKSGSDRRRMLLNFCKTVSDPLLSKTNARTFLLYRDKTTAGANTQNHILAYWSSTFNQLRALGVPENPFAEVRKIKFDKTEVRFLSSEEISSLILTLENYPQHAPFFKLSLSTGLRLGEVVSLKNSDFINGGVYLKTTKSGRPRFVPVADSLALECKNALPFAVAHQTITKIFKEAGITLPRGQSFHVLRHTFATHFLQNGGDLYALSQILGHSSIQMTMRYSHLTNETLKKALVFNPLATRI
jgi:integrase